MEQVAALAAWVGVSLVVVSDGRRGLALGVALATAGIAILTFGTVGAAAATALAAGGAVAAIRRFASGPEGWGILPPGSTPRLVLCLAAGIIAFWFAAGVAGGAGAPLRFAVMLVIGLAGSRVLSSAEASGLITATAVVALGVGGGAALEPGSSAAWASVAAGVVAAVLAWLPARAEIAA